MSVTKVISGGQVGADIAGLRAAKRLGLETTGWIPLGFRTKLGPRPEYAEMYGLRETPDEGYSDRTALNVMQSDATVRFAWDWCSAGETLTLKYIREMDKPYFDVDISRGGEEESSYLRPPPDEFKDWLVIEGIQTLNVAGNSSPWIESLVEDYLLGSLDPEMWPPYEC